MLSIPRATPFAIPPSPAHIAVVKPDADDEIDKAKKVRRPRAQVDWREAHAVLSPWASHPQIVC